ncbi:GAF and ANTAR domain-containing protein [Rathayibacter sp. VKM Ac-2927]|uniref:GAF and ANTAR domain-containing protein n=1 Tax=Rathayibacter sp. VKM Ac-2927 TaxID=2929478 RepID=UPI001FB28595|nr:GAF and ANTAR domain-containing protein [Rathayibacter sp. VKM Ac-2927]MCJ1688565.1 GAF and ANTAR domain-containing protein [Rathayibacter sp. VKM Ac-2927]
MSVDDADPTDAVHREDPEDLATLLASFMTLLPVEDAAASLLGAPFDIETLVASSTRAARLDDAQIDLGEGPAWHAYRNYRPAYLHLSNAESGETWPMFTPVAASEAVETVVSLPLLVGTSSIGAVSLFGSQQLHLDVDGLRLATGLASVLAKTIVARALEEADRGEFPRDPVLSRREVHQATGMVLAQTKTSAADALLLIRAYAFSAGLTVRDVAARIIARTLDFTPDLDFD